MLVFEGISGGCCDKCSVNSSNPVEALAEQTAALVFGWCFNYGLLSSSRTEKQQVSALLGLYACALES